MNNRFYFFFCITFLVSINTFAQSIHLSGTVFDKETQIPISGISIHTKDNQTGTISTVKGKFSIEISISKENSYLYFTSVGYETDSILISKANNPLSIKLIPKTYTLKEVYIMPDSTLLTLLRKAYNKIPENYPAQPTRYEGFFQESTSNEKDSLIEIIEAVLSVYKESYKEKKEAPGQIEIIKSRIKQFQNSKVGFAGGAFIPVDDDFVLQRRNFINPKQLKHFQYEFVGIKIWKGRVCYEIEFRPFDKDSDNVQGTILIDVETLAYLSFEISVSRRENAKLSLGIMKPVETKIKVIYEQQNGKWHLKQVTVNTIHENWRIAGSLYTSLAFITTAIQIDSVKPITVEKRLEYLDPIEAKTSAYNPKGWTDSDILAKEDVTQMDFQFSTDEASSIFQQKLPKKISFTGTIIKILPKLIIGYGLNYNPNLQLLVSQGVLGYRFNKKWSIRWQSAEDFYNKHINFSENSLGLEFRKNFNNTGYPIFLGTSLWISDKNYVGNYNFQRQTITPQLSISKRISKFITLEVFANYPITIHSKNKQDISGYSPNFGVVFYLF
ncbi:MAG: carboxypeptidase-like regulatory domain-containing protein [Bacteroidales bacterium]|jgi:hypothetical protein|nr:carboxypeptidase-like regulatory domain-containing protein [Bacteroidales bacterium]